MGTPVLVCDPEKVRTRAADLIRTGREFLEASWSVAAVGGAAPIDVEAARRLGFPRTRRGPRAARRQPPGGRCSQLHRRIRSWNSTSGPAPVGAQPKDAVEEIFAMLRAHVATGGSPRWSPRAPEPRTASSSSSANPTLPAAHVWSPGRTPAAGVVGVLKGPLHDGLVLPGANLVIITEIRPDR